MATRGELEELIRGVPGVLHYQIDDVVVPGEVKFTIFCEATGLDRVDFCTYIDLVRPAGVIFTYVFKELTRKTSAGLVIGDLIYKVECSDISKNTSSNANYPIPVVGCTTTHVEVQMNFARHIFQRDTTDTGHTWDYYVLPAVVVHNDRFPKICEYCGTSAYIGANIIDHADGRRCP